MVRRALRSRSLRRVKVRTPGGKLKTHYKRRKPSIAKCRDCGKPLSGVPRLRPADLRKLPKTKRRPQRMFGGNLCSACMREFLREKVRSLK